LLYQGQALASQLSAQSKPGQHVEFLYTNVQSHLANLGLFDLALKTCGRIDHAASVAGINREEDIGDAKLTMESVRKVRSFVSFNSFLAR
jgi:NAD(P)-dependent dehydrogenase (short-subunit alcohol dehydrogenase family)